MSYYITSNPNAPSTSKGEEKPITTSKIRFAIVGAGLIAAKNAAAIHACPTTELVFVGGRDAVKVQAFAKKHNVPKFGSMEEACISDIVDAVYLCVPTAVRTPWALRAIASGKHVIVEKPVAPTLGEVKQIVRAASEANVIYMDGTMWRQATRTAHLHKLLHQDKQFGRVLHTSTSFFVALPPEGVENGIRGQPELEPLGAVGDMAWYSLGMAAFAFDYQFPVKVRAVTESCPTTGNTYHTAGLLEFPGSRTATFDGGYKLALRQNAEIVCEKGTVGVNDFVNPPYSSFVSFLGPSAAKPATFTLLDASKGSGVVLAGEPRRVVLPITPDDDNHTEDLPVVHFVHEVEMFFNFAKACMEKRQNEEWIKSSLATQALVEGVLASAAQDGKTVEVEAPF